MTKIIKFPGAHNKLLEKQQHLMQCCSNTIEAIMQMPHWDQIEIQQQDLEVLADFGERMTFSPGTQPKLISMLANQLLKKNLEEEFL